MPLLPLFAGVGGGALVSVTPATGTVIPVGAAAQRVNFVGSGTTWLSTAPTITVSAGSLGAITVDSNTTAHANYTPAGSPQTVVFTSVTDASTTANLSVVAAATGYSLSGPSGGQVGVASANFTVTLVPAGSAVAANVVVTPVSSPEGTISGPVTFNANTASASGTFTVTPAASGAHTISTSDNGGLSDPGSLLYTATDATGPSLTIAIARPVYFVEQTMRPVFYTQVIVRPVYFTETMGR